MFTESVQPTNKQNTAGMLLGKTISEYKVVPRKYEKSSRIIYKYSKILKLNVQRQKL